MPYTNVPAHLTEKMDKCVKDVMAKEGYEKSRAIAICHSSVVKSEVLMSMEQRIAKSEYETAMGTDDGPRQIRASIGLHSTMGNNNVQTWREILQKAKGFGIPVTMQDMELAGLTRNQMIEVVQGVDTDFMKADDEADFQKGMAAGHKYWKREGAPGHYQYFYEDDKGQKKHGPGFAKWDEKTGRMKAPEMTGEIHPSEMNREQYPKDAPKSRSVAVRHTKSGHPITEAHAKRQYQAAFDASEKAHNRTYPKDRGGMSEYDAHKRAADASGQAAWYAHHAGDSDGYSGMMDQANYHATKAKELSGQNPEHGKDHDSDYRYHKRMLDAADLAGHESEEGYFHPDNMKHVRGHLSVPRSKRQKLTVSKDVKKSEPTDLQKSVEGKPLLQAVLSFVEKGADHAAKIAKAQKIKDTRLLADELAKSLHNATAGQHFLRNAIMDLGVTKDGLKEMIEARL